MCVCERVRERDHSYFLSPRQWGQSLRFLDTGVCFCMCVRVRNAAMFWSHGLFDFKKKKKTGQGGWDDRGRYDSGLQLLYSPAFNSPYVGLSAVWDGILQCKAFCLYFFPFFFLADISFFSPCSFALRHWWGPVKLLVGWDWNSNQICKPICQRQYESKVNFDKRKKFTHTFLTHLRLQCPLMAAQAHTHQVL